MPPAYLNLPNLTPSQQEELVSSFRRELQARAPRSIFNLHPRMQSAKQKDVQPDAGGKYRQYRPLNVGRARQKGANFDLVIIKTPNKGSVASSDFQVVITARVNDKRDANSKVQINAAREFRKEINIRAAELGFVAKTDIFTPAEKTLLKSVDRALAKSRGLGVEFEQMAPIVEARVISKSEKSNKGTVASAQSKADAFVPIEEATQVLLMQNDEFRQKVLAMRQQLIFKSRALG